MSRLVLSTLLAASAVWAHPHLSRNTALTPQVYDACINANDIALTFDDGPWIFLRSISDQFTAAGAKAYLLHEREQLRLHLQSRPHRRRPDLTELSTPQIQDAMFRMEEAFSRILGIKPAFMRPPFGDFNDNIQSIAAARGQSLALWDWDTGDADGNTTAQSEAVYNDVVNAKVKNALILEHETEQTTNNTLVPFAIKLFQSKGYNLVTMAECEGVDPYQAIGVPQQPSASWTCDDTPDPGAACGGSITCETGTPVFSSTTTAPSGPTPTATFIHPTANAAKCLTAASNTDGAAVEIEDCVSGGSTTQGWTVSGSNLQIFGSKCLDVTNGVATNGNKMQIWTCAAGNTNQMWTLSGSTIQWSAHSSCLDLTDSSVTNGNLVQIWACTAGPNQQWTQTTAGVAH
ncbi:hypothetical protein B0H14DRAFT_3479318 [Mycena olivaceomarginata]|nr:hypothetical protein B0H14DRAFT_3479318 [Mycena olivaceomarginata]